MQKAIRVFLLGVITLTCTLLAIPALGQSDVGTIVGFVRDQSGDVVPGASVTIRNEGTAAEQTVTADSQGRYTVPNLRPADYTMSVEAKGFKKFISTHNTLAANSTIDLDATLEIGQLTQTVEVTATASVLQTESEAVQAQVTGQQIRDQQLNGRNPLYMGQMRFPRPLANTCRKPCGSISTTSIDTRITFSIGPAQTDTG